MQYSRGTTTVSIDSIDTEEVLTLDSDADIFLYDGVIYKTNIAWVEELIFTKDVQIGEIKTNNDANTDFKNEMSNKLPVGNKCIFRNMIVPHNYHKTVKIHMGWTF